MSDESITFRDYLPPVYHQVLPELLSARVPRETRATCDDCVMCAKDPVPPGPDPLERKFFSPDTKCCTFHPSLPNFLVGAILSSPEPGMETGRRRLREKIRRGIGVTPRGVLAPRKYQLFYDQGAEFFGRSSQMLCPYYDRGQCTIWLYREAVCTTYFCKYVRGTEGKQLWEDLKRYLGFVELKLSLYGLSQLEPRPERLAAVWDSWDNKGAVGVEEIEDRDLPEAKRKEIWGEWMGREEEFYLGCYEKVRALDRPGFLAALGIDELVHRARLEVSLGKVTSGKLPTRLRKNPELRAVRQGADYLCSPTRMGDAFELNGLVFPLLEAFDGTRDTASVLAEIAQARKISLSVEIVAKLYYLGVLVESV